MVLPAYDQYPPNVVVYDARGRLLGTVLNPVGPHVVGRGAGTDYLERLMPRLPHRPRWSRARAGRQASRV